MEIRRADAKGRVTGFKPWRYYKIRGDSAVEVALSLIHDVESAMPAPLPDRAQDYLRKFGIDPMHVLRDEINPAGYWETSLDEGFFNLHGARDRVRREWPEDFHWGKFTDLALLDLKET